MYSKHLEECLAHSERPQVLAAAIVVTDHVTSSRLLVCVCAVLWQVTPSSALLLDVLHGIWNALQLTVEAPRLQPLFHQCVFSEPCLCVSRY